MSFFCENRIVRLKIVSADISTQNPRPRSYFSRISVPLVVIRSIGDRRVRHGLDVQEGISQTEKDVFLDHFQCDRFLSGKCGREARGDAEVGTRVEEQVKFSCRCSGKTKEMF